MRVILVGKPLQQFFVQAVQRFSISDIHQFYPVPPCSGLQLDIVTQRTFDESVNGGASSGIGMIIIRLTAYSVAQEACLRMKEDADCRCRRKVRDIFRAERRAFEDETPVGTVHVVDSPLQERPHVRVMNFQEPMNGFG